VARLYHTPAATQRLRDSGTHSSPAALAAAKPGDQGSDGRLAWGVDAMLP